MNWIADIWCKTMHNRPMWPIHGKYICPQCLREFAVHWEEPVMREEYARPELRHRIGETQTVSVVQ